jgi:hypothetical protein
MSRRRGLPSRRTQVASWSRYLAFGLTALSLASHAGCGGDRDVPVGDAAENIRKLSLAYVQYAAASGGVGPADQKSLTKFMVERNGIPQDEAEKSFVSIRDNQPYIIRWGVRPQGSGPLGAEAPKPVVIVVERTGADGLRYVADSRPSVNQMTEDEIKQLVPDLSFAN